MKCNKCGGQVVSLQNCVHYTDGSSSGHYWCQGCGAKKDWFIKGQGEQIIDMSLSEDKNNDN